MKHPLSLESSTSFVPACTGDQVQPNAIDVTVGKIFRINDGLFGLSKEGKKHRGSEELEPVRFAEQMGKGWHLTPGTYEIVMEQIIEVGEDEAGWIVPRSTLNRNGLFITSGLYDSNYKGVMAGALHVTTGDARIEQGARVGQFLLFDAEAVHLYSGSYGINSDHDQKYK